MTGSADWQPRFWRLSNLTILQGIASLLEHEIGDHATDRQLRNSEPRPGQILDASGARTWAWDAMACMKTFDATFRQQFPNPTGVGVENAGIGSNEFYLCPDGPSLWRLSRPDTEGCIMTTLFRRRYTVTLYTSEAGLDLRDEIGEVLMDIENDSIVRGTVENQGDETEVSDEESERELDAAEVGFTSLSEEEYAELQKDDD